MAQTTDGYLWIGSARGLFRFDGVEFEPYVVPPSTSPTARNIYALSATTDGGLWIAFRPNGIGFLKDGRLKVYSRPGELPASEVFCLASDADGRVWAGTLNGLILFDGERWVEAREDWNLKNERVWSMFTDRDGTFWLAAGDTVYFLRKGSRSFQQTGLRTVGVPQITQSRDGRFWKTEWEKPVSTIPPPGETSTGDEIQIGIAAHTILFDRDGTLWMGGLLSDGIKRYRFPEKLDTLKLDIRSPEVESFNAGDGLTDNSVGHIMEDREGNIWVSTTKGLDRFSYRHFASVDLPPTYVSLTLLTAENGDILVASRNDNPLLRVNADRIINEHVRMEASSFYRDPNGTTWWGGHGGIWKEENGEYQLYPHPGGKSGWFWELFPDGDSNGLWARLGDHGLVHFKDGVWDASKKKEGLPEKGPSASFNDQEGKVWLGYSSGKVYCIEGDKVTSFSLENGLNIGKIKVIRSRGGGRFWFGGETGLALMESGRISTVNTATDPFGAISGIVETGDGDLWIMDDRGMVHIAGSEVRQVLNDRNYGVSYRLYTFLDGISGGSQMNYTVSTAVEATDGRIWFATDNGLTWIDPARRKINTLPPPVAVKSLTVDMRTYRSYEQIELPKGTENLRINYTALSLSIPERVLFKYMLEGVDDDWQDAGTHREAFFTNLGPGEYRFRVIASNNDGIWNEEGAELKFTILPLFYQTNWFLVLCVAALIFMAFLGYKWRVRQVKSVLQMQFQERLAERTRIAQDLHDTLLQGFVSAKMQLFAEVHDLPADTPKTKRLKGVYELLGQLIEDGRNTVRNLRASDYDEFTDFEKEFLKIREEFDLARKIDLKMIIRGTPRPLHPLIGSELLHIGHEALINAFLHSGASVLEIEIEYGIKSLNLLVRDNGCGIDADILRSGREGHWGLTGMRERAEKIKAEIRILSRVNAGTEVVVAVPRRFAYKDAGLFSAWIRKRVASDPEKDTN